MEYLIEDVVRAAQRDVPRDAYHTGWRLHEALANEAKRRGENPNVWVAKGLAHLMQGPRGSRRRQQDVATLPAGAVLGARMIARAVASKVAQCRQEVFGQSTPPYTTYQEARQWLQDQSARCPYTSEQWERRHAEAVELVPGLRFMLPVDRAWLPVDPFGGIPAWTDQLQQLAGWVEWISSQTGWSPHATLAYLLAGTLPVDSWPAVSFSMFSPELGWTTATVRLRPWHLSGAQFRALQSEIERFPAAVRRGVQRLRLTPHEGRLVDLICDSGTGLPPSRGRGRRGKYWQELATQWKRNYRKAQTPEAVRKLWERLEVRLKREAPEILTLLEQAEASTPAGAKILRGLESEG